MLEENENLDNEELSTEQQEVSTDDLFDQFLDEESEESEESEAPVETQPSTPEDKKFKVFDGNEEREVTLEELKSNDALLRELTRSSMRFKDYSQKTQELSQQRQQLTAEQQEVQQKVAQIEQYIPGREYAIQNEWNDLSKYNLAELNQTDPVEAQRVFFRRQELENEYKQIQQVKNEVSTFRQNEHNARIESEREPAMEFIKSNIPLFASGDEKQQAILKDEIVKYGMTKYGLTADDFNNMDGIVGARQIVALYEGLMYSKLAQNANKIVKTKEVRKTAPTVEHPSSHNDIDDGTNEVLQQARKARKSGNVRDLKKSTSDLLDSIL